MMQGLYQNIDEVTYKLSIFDIQMNDKDFTRDARASKDSSTPSSATFSCNVEPKLVTLSQYCNSLLVTLL